MSVLAEDTILSEQQGAVLLFLRSGRAETEAAPTPEPSPVNPKENTMSTTATESVKTADPAKQMQSLYNDLLKSVKATVKGVKIEEKAAYARVGVKVGDKVKTVLYINHPSKKSVRLEWPREGVSGYDVEKLAAPSDLEKAIATFKVRAEALASA